MTRCAANEAREGVRADAPANRLKTRISRLIQEVRSPRKKRQAPSGRPRCSTLTREAGIQDREGQRGEPLSTAARWQMRPQREAGPAAICVSTSMPDERPVRVLQPQPVGIGGARIRRARSCAWCRAWSAWCSWSRKAPGTSRSPGSVAAAICSLRDDADGDGRARAGLHAGRRFVRREPVVAHVALAHDAAALRVLRHVVGALEHAILAADALVIEVAHDAGLLVLFVGHDRAAIEAGRVRRNGGRRS